MVSEILPTRSSSSRGAAGHSSLLKQQPPHLCLRRAASHSLWPRCQLQTHAQQQGASLGQHVARPFQACLQSASHRQQQQCRLLMLPLTQAMQRMQEQQSLREQQQQQCHQHQQIRQHHRLNQQHHHHHQQQECHSLQLGLHPPPGAAQDMQVYLAMHMHMLRAWWVIPPTSAGKG